LLALSPDALCFIREDGRLERVNPAFERVVGARAAAVRERPFAELFHPDDRPIVAEWLRAADAGVPGVPVVLRCLGGDQAYRSLSWSLSPRDSAGMALAIGRTALAEWPAQSAHLVQASGDDATSDDRVAVLRAREERFRTLSAVSPIGIFETNGVGQLTYANPHFIALWGAEGVDAVLGHAWLARVDADDRATLARAWESAVSARAEFVHEYRIVLPNAVVRRVRAHSVPLHDGTGAMIGTVEDVTARVQAQASLRASEERYRLLIETSHEGICQVDAAGVVTYANERLGRMLACDAAALRGRTLFEFMDPEAAVAARASLARRQRGISETDELPLRRRDGTTLWARMSVSPTFEADGVFSGAMFMLSDITSRHDAEQRLAESERLFRALTEQSSEVVAIIDADGAIRYANPACARLLGYEFGEAIGRPAFDFVHPDDVVRVRGEFDALVRQPRALLSIEYRVSRAGAPWCVLSVVAQNRLDDPAIAGVVVNGHDVTARRSADAALRGQKELLQTVFDHIPAMIVLFDPTGRPALANGEWTRRSGWTIEEMCARDWVAEMFPDAEACLRVRGSIDAAAGSWNDRRMHVRDGRVVETVWAVVRISDGSRVGIGQDVTEQRQLEHQLRQAQKLEAVGRLAGGVAHDFNNLLSVIASYSGIVYADLEVESPLRNDMLEIQRAVDRGAALTRQLLAFGRQQVLQPRVLNLADVIRGTLGMLRRLIGEDVQVSIDAGRRDLRVKLDPGQLEQVLMNLAVNARDAMPAGGVLRMAIDEMDVNDEQARRLTGGIIGSFVRLRVTDDGLGMDEATRIRVFEPFFTTKKPGQGTGLGLATVYGIVKQSGGFIWVDSRPGAGTAFTILLPRTEECDEPASAVDAPPATEHAGGETVLLVEDDAALRAVARRLLDHSGYNVLEATDGADALLQAVQRRTKVDLVITDIVMPYLSGQEMMRHLTPMFGDVPVLFMSGYAIEAVERHGELLPGAKFLSKPFSPTQFLDAVANTLAAGSRGVAAPDCQLPRT
jgi:PAS domain S-box-containing protein